MDSMHDLGGRAGFGPVDTDEEEGFHSDWEARAFAIVKAMQRAPDWTIDWFRHCRELIEPVDYLTRPYYDQWLQTYAAMMVNSGIATVAEIASGKSTTGSPGLPAPMTAADVETQKHAVPRFVKETNETPALAPGDRVRAHSHGALGHTRLPAYVRGRCGVIESSHGAHVFPDANALGDKRAEPLYTVVFEAAELWPEAAGRRERISLDLWQSYLARA